MRPPAAARLVLLPFLIAWLGFADTIRFRDGSSVDGTLVGASNDEIRFSVNGEVQQYARNIVAGIDLSPARADVPPPAPTNGSEPDWLVKGPDYPNAPFLRGANGFIPLEHEIATASRGGGIPGLGGGAPVYRVPGASSQVRVRRNDFVVFVLRLDSGWNPNQFQLFRLESRMGTRQTQPSAGGAPVSLPLEIRKVGNSVYEIAPARALAPGEYAVSPANSNDSYCFGVDY